VVLRDVFVILFVLVVPDGFDVHENDAGTQLRGLVHGEVPLDPRGARRVVHRDDPAPLLDNQRRARVDAQPPRLHLRVERVQVEVDDHAPIRGSRFGGSANRAGRGIHAVEAWNSLRLLGRVVAVSEGEHPQDGREDGPDQRGRVFLHRLQIRGVGRLGTRVFPPAAAHRVAAGETRARR